MIAHLQSGYRHRPSLTRQQDEVISIAAGKRTQRNRPARKTPKTAVFYSSPASKDITLLPHCLFPIAAASCPERLTLPLSRFAHQQFVVPTSQQIIDSIS